MCDLNGKELLNSLMHSQLFMGMNEAALKDFSKIVKTREAKTGEIVFSEGEKAEGFYIVIEGRIKVYKISAAGKSQIIHIFGPGNPFGEAAIFMQNRFPAYAEAMSPCELAYIKFEEFLKYLKKDPQFALNIIATLCVRLKAFLKTIEELSLDEVSTRLAKYILSMASERKPSGTSSDKAVVTLNIKKNVLANQLGTIPETLSRTLAKLKKQGLIIIDKKTITIPSIEKLSELAGL